MERLRERHRLGAMLALMVVGLLATGCDSSDSSSRSPGQTSTSTTGLEFAATGPHSLTATVTNEGTTSCRFPTTALGVMSVASIREHDAAITPLLTSPHFVEPLELSVLDDLRLLAPGDSVDLPIPVVPAGPTGHGIEVTTWSPLTGPVGYLYPISTTDRLTLDAAISWDFDLDGSEGEEAFCLPGTTTQVVEGVASGGSQAPQFPEPDAWIVMIIAASAMGLTVRLVVRRRHTGVATLAVVVMVGSVCVAVPSGADAEIRVGESVQAAFGDCMSQFRADDPAGILPTLEAEGITVTIRPGPDNYERSWGPNILVDWNVDQEGSYHGSGVSLDRCASLYHELAHAHADASIPQTERAGLFAECVTSSGPTGISLTEVVATRAENLFRRSRGLPERTTYGFQPLPTEECRPTSPMDRYCINNVCRCPRGGCGKSVGEPHLATFDGTLYDFQGAGEFVAARDERGGFEVQVRQSPYAGSDLVAINRAVAAEVEGSTVEIRGGPVSPVVLIDGVTTRGGGPLPNGGSVTTIGGPAPAVVIAWSDESTLAVSDFGVAGLSVNLFPAAERRALLGGLFGDADGDPTNDVRPDGGDPIIEPNGDRLYPDFADSWRVDADTSLFTYDRGDGVDTYRDVDFPSRRITPDDVAATGSANQLCRAFGVTEPGVLDDCIFDVSVTGRAEFAVAAAAGQGPSLVLDGPARMLPATSNIYAAGSGPLPITSAMGSAPLNVVLEERTTAIAFPEIVGEIGPAGRIEHDADGGGDRFPRTDISAFNGLPGVRHDSRSLFLVGVFTPVAPSASSAPDPIDMTDADRDVEIAPGLGQLFYIGNGLTVSGERRHVMVPAGAQGLQIGFADANFFTGQPGHYDDNMGALSIRVVSSDG